MGYYVRYYYYFITHDENFRSVHSALFLFLLFLLFVPSTWLLHLLFLKTWKWPRLPRTTLERLWISQRLSDLSENVGKIWRVMECFSRRWGQSQKDSLDQITLTLCFSSRLELHEDTRVMVEGSGFHYFGLGFCTFDLLTAIMREDTDGVPEDPGLPPDPMLNILLPAVFSPRQRLCWPNHTGQVYRAQLNRSTACHSLQETWRRFHIWWA